jgi:hypothetical protein
MNLSSQLPQKYKIGGSQLARLGIHVKPYLKIAKAKRAGNVAQMVEQLPCKSEALSSKSSTAKKRFKCTQKERETNKENSNAPSSHSCF